MKSGEAKAKEVKKQEGLSSAQHQVLMGLIGPVEEKKESDFAELLESAGTDIQTVIDNKDMDFSTKKVCLERAMREDSKQFDISLSQLLPSSIDKYARQSLKTINNFCFDN